jgi:hypothetical protein
MALHLHVAADRIRFAVSFAEAFPEGWKRSPAAWPTRMA